MATKIFQEIKEHWSAILLAFILGLLVVWPFFYFQISLGGEYKGILNQVIDDELFYMARIKDVMDGHPTLGNAYLSEYKNQLPQQLFLPEWLLAQPLKFLNLDVIQGRVFYSFIFPAVAFILTYIALYLIYPSRFWANIFSVFLLFGLYLFKFTRPVIPQFVFLFWLTQFILLWLLIKNESFDTLKYQRISKKGVLSLNILNFGILFYLYPFYWTFYLVLLAVLAFIYFFMDRLLSKKFLKILLGGLVIGSFYFYLTFLTAQLPEFQEALTRLQLVFSRSPSEIKSVSLSLVVLLSIGILYWLKRIKISKEIIFFIAGILSILIVTNQNIITGQKFEFGHYRMLAIFFIVFTIYYLLVPYETARARSVTLFRMGWSQIKLIVASLVIITSLTGVYNYIQKMSRISEHDIYIQKYAIIFDWLNENTPPDSVVYADSVLSELIPVYTSNNVFYTRAANLFFVSDREVLERFVLNNFFERFDRNFVIENERAIWGVRYIDRYGDAVQANKWRRLLGLKLKDETRLPEEGVGMIMAQAAELQKVKLKDGLKNYRVDYLVWDREVNSHWKISEKEFEKIAELGHFYIFKVH